MRGSRSRSFCSCTSAFSISCSGSLILKKNRGYTLSYSNNTDAGTATVTITGKGRYQGELKRTFTIKKASMKTNKQKSKKSIPRARRAAAIKRQTDRKL